MTDLPQITDKLYVIRFCTSPHGQGFKLTNFVIRFCTSPHGQGFKLTTSVMMISTDYIEMQMLPTYNHSHRGPYLTVVSLVCRYGNKMKYSEISILSGDKMDYHKVYPFLEEIKWTIPNYNLWEGDKMDLPKVYLLREIKWTIPTYSFEDEIK